MTLERLTPAMKAIADIDMYGTLTTIFLNRRGVSGDSSVCGLSGLLGSVVSVVRGFEFDRWDVATVLVESALVVPVDPFGGGQFDLFDGAPSSDSNTYGGTISSIPG